jgi:putative sterol carrier protein
MPTVKQLFETMPESFDQSAAAQIHAVIQFDVTGDGGGRWYAAIDHGTLRVVEGTVESPSLTITVSAQDYIDVSTGALNEQLAFMTGRLTARGDTALAMRLPKIFKRG